MKTKNMLCALPKVASNLRRKVALVGLGLALTAANASAAIDPTEATEAIDTATGHAETVAIAGFAVAGMFLVVRLIKRGIRSAG